MSLARHAPVDALGSASTMRRRKDPTDVMEIAGIVCISIGAFSFSVGLGFVVLGGLLLTAGYLLSGGGQ